MVLLWPTRQRQNCPWHNYGCRTSPLALASHKATLPGGAGGIQSLIILASTALLPYGLLVRHTFFAELILSGPYPHTHPWLAMRVISLGIRTVPVLSVAKKLAAPRSSSDITCRQHVPADERAWMRTDCRLGAEKLWPCCCFFSLHEVMTGQGELTECSKLTCFAKRMLDMVPGDSGKWDRRSLSATVRDRRRTCQVESELGKGKNKPNTTYLSSKEKEKAILNARIQIQERVKQPNWGRRSIDELLCACMHALRAAAELQCTLC